MTGIQNNFGKGFFFSSEEILLREDDSFDSRGLIHIVYAEMTTEVSSMLA